MWIKLLVFVWSFAVVFGMGVNVALWSVVYYLHGMCHESVQYNVGEVCMDESFEVLKKKCVLLWIFLGVVSVAMLGGVYTRETSATSSTQPKGPVGEEVAV
jgi:hypothetical protein